jgi:hypothetical protein
MRTLRRYLKPVVLLLVQGLFSLADVLMGFVADKSGDSDTIVTTTATPPPISRADVEAALTDVRIRASVDLAGFSEGTADYLIAARIDPAMVDKMLAAALAGPMQ